MKLEQLFKELSKNPNVIKSIEMEIQSLINANSIDQTLELYKSPIPEMKIYAIKIIEERIKLKKIKNENLDIEILAMKNIVFIDDNDKTAEVFAKLGIFEWPKMFPDFFQIIIDFISNKHIMGYKILYKFLYKFLYLLNNSQEINDKRKGELKKALRIIYKGYMQLFEDEFAIFIIPILTESLKILPKDFDYSIIYRKGFEFPEQTIEFVNDMGDALNIVDVIELSSKMPISVGMLIYFNSIKNKSPNTPNVTKMYEYVYKGLRVNMSTFLISLDFWLKFFLMKNKDQFVDQILTEVISIFVSLDENNKSEVESEVWGFFNVLIRNYTERAYLFVKTNGDRLPKKLGLFFIKKLHEQLKYKPYFKFSDLNFQDAVLRGTVLELCSDERVLELIEYLDLSDKDTAKLCMRVINKFPVSEMFLNKIIAQCYCPGKETANEVIVECCIKLDKIEKFDGAWDDDKCLRFFYYLKRVPMKVAQYSSSFLNIFIEKSPFNRCFSILRMLGDFPKEIYEKIYVDILRYPYEDLACFNRDLLLHLQLQDPFIRREIDRLLHDWNILENTDLLILCTKSLLSVISDGINKSNTEKRPYSSIDSLFDLLRIDDSGIIRKISEMFCTYNGPFDVKKALYFLLVNYNSSYVESSHLNVSAALTKCIKSEGGAEALHEILNGIPLDNCINLRNDCLKYNTKRGQTLVRNFLRSFKGKPLSTLYENSFKVREQNFINNSKKVSGFEFEIDKTFFG
ncbi:exportin-1 [Vairimorpha necatrix]|uniref:Exportin-1 n=1 Tax=Vairimorpha necatrix TaxID=6039 RepID=A0AAX4JCD0_9MICR